MNYPTKSPSENRYYMKRIVIISLLWSLSIIAFAIPQRPTPPRLINDLANVLTDSEENQLEQEVLTLYQNTSTQIAVVTVNDLEGMDVSSFAFALGQEWGVGSEKFNNGIVVLLKSKTSDTDRGEVFIATGYGLEGAVPDIVCKRIVDNEMIPWFKKGSYFNGISAAVVKLVDLSKGEYSAKQYMASTKSTKKSKSWGVLPLIVIFIVFRLLFSRRSVGVGKALPWWFLFSALGSSSSRGSFNDFSNSSGSFGGGGGFGGFGGGSFGGGGAGGSW